MNYIEFLQSMPDLTGYIVVNGKAKEGIFKSRFNKYSNRFDYRYYSLKGHVGKGGFTTKSAFDLLSVKLLHLI